MFKNLGRLWLSAFGCLIFASVGFGATGQGHVNHKSPVAVCDDENFWPPYAFQAEGEVTGAMIELTSAIFQEMGIEHRLQMMPWKRCLSQVENFSGDPAFEVFINGSFSEERSKKFLVSDSVYSTGSAYFYSNTRFKTPPKVEQLSDLRNYSLCGVHGYNYEMYQVEPKHLKVAAGDLHAAFRLLKSGRCDIILNAYSVPFGSRFTDDPMIDDTVSAKIFTQLPSQGFHIFVSRKTPRAQFLIEGINRSIQALTTNGTVDQIFRKYLPDCGAQC